MDWCAQDAFCINVGKIYGIMDDLRTESSRVQEKHIAAAKSLIASTDIDGFRIDTPMQARCARDGPAVPPRCVRRALITRCRPRFESRSRSQVDLGFFKAWAPAVKKFAKEALNKTNFGMWGEFFVNTGRYATMMGRGKNRTMWGTDKFIDDVFTLNGGIAYPYYHYMRVKLFGGEVEIQWPLDDEYRDRYDGPVVLWQEEVDAADTYNPQARRATPRAPRHATRAAPRHWSVTPRVPREPADGARREHDVALL